LDINLFIIDMDGQGALWVVFSGGVLAAIASSHVYCLQSL